MIQTVQSERRPCWPYSGTFRKNARSSGMAKDGRKKQCRNIDIIPGTQTPKYLVPFLKSHQTMTGMAAAMLKDLSRCKNRCRYMRRTNRHSMNMEMRYPHMGR